MCRLVATEMCRRLKHHILQAKEVESLVCVVVGTHVCSPSERPDPEKSKAKTEILCGSNKSKQSDASTRLPQFPWQ
jgi:hypothetical protein